MQKKHLQMFTYQSVFSKKVMDKKAWIKLYQ